MKGSHCIFSLILLLLWTGCDAESAGKKAAKQKVDDLMAEMEATEIGVALDSNADYKAFIEEVRQLNSKRAHPALGESLITDHVKERAQSTDALPSFPGGDTALYNYLLNGIRVLNDTSYSLKTVVALIIDSEGRIISVNVAQSSGNEIIDAEAKGLIEKMPPWKPGYMKGEALSTQYLIPIDFARN